MRSERRGDLRVGRTLGDSVTFWRRDLRALTILAAGLELPLVVAELALHVTPGLKELTEDSVTISAVSLLVILYGSLSHHFLAGLLERVVGAERRGHPQPGLREVLRDLPWHRLLLADLLFTAMIVVGLSLFVVPGLVVLTWFCVTLPIINLERNPVLASFRRSYRLVRGHPWRVFLVALAAFVVPEVVVAAVATVVHHVTDDAALNAVGHAIPAIALMPIAALPIVVLAFDLVDIDAARADPAPGVPARAGAEHVAAPSRS